MCGGEVEERDCSFPQAFYVGAERQSGEEGRDTHKYTQTHTSRHADLSLVCLGTPVSRHACILCYWENLGKQQ